MLNISKEEAKAFKERFPDKFITIVNRYKKSDRKKYFVEDTLQTRSFLAKFNASNSYKANDNSTKNKT